MLLRYYILSMVLMPCLCSYVKIDRDAADLIHSNYECVLKLPRASGWFSCTCKSNYTTIMSKDGEKLDCRTPEEIGCKYSLLESQQTYVITKSRVTMTLIPRITGKCRSSYIHRIFIWNLNYSTERGTWCDVTNETLTYFNLQNNSKDSFLAISNLNTKVWSGQLIKIELGMGRCNSCVTVKVKGGITYPIDINTFKSSLTKLTTTRSSSITAATRRPITKGAKHVKFLSGHHSNSKLGYKVIIYAVVGAVGTVVCVLALIVYRKRICYRNMKVEKQSDAVEEKDMNIVCTQIRDNVYTSS